MAIACFDQFEGLLELAKPALEALTPRRLKSITTPKVNPAVVVPATVVCRAKGDGVPAGLLCRVSVQGELLMLGCHRRWQPFSAERAVQFSAPSMVRGLFLWRVLRGSLAIDPEVVAGSEVGHLEL
ncbi:unnamed protein product [Durusdinium trenchii]|uniref:Uncharacterized protein n=1 Tax=Durusdinium trenchii TaxID=1381693 RepID=A0ABP0SXE0_9DINO